MKVKSNVEINLIKTREMRIANSKERNILMNRIAHEYPNKFISFFKDYLKQKNNADELIRDFQDKINELCSIDCTKTDEELTDNISNQPDEIYQFDLFEPVINDETFDFVVNDEIFVEEESEFLIKFFYVIKNIYIS